jgi:hypothetical protein
MTPEDARLFQLDGLTPKERRARATVWAGRQDSLFDDDVPAVAGRTLELRDGLEPLDVDVALL